MIASNSKLKSVEEAIKIEQAKIYGGRKIIYC